jgi:hypothetical protein
VVVHYCNFNFRPFSSFRAAAVGFHTPDTLVSVIQTTAVPRLPVTRTLKCARTQSEEDDGRKALEEITVRLLIRPTSAETSGLDRMNCWAAPYDSVRGTYTTAAICATQNAASKKPSPKTALVIRRRTRGDKLLTSRPFRFEAARR